MVAIASTPPKSSKYRPAEDHFSGFGANSVGPELGDQENEPAIDLVHLSRQTLSDQALEVELLDMFDRQSARIMAQLRESGAADAKLCANLAHTLRGSALAVGAGRVARSAHIYEAQCAAPVRGTSTGAALEALADAVREARSTIAELLGH
jgi:HPt (histidine-containing phosphotransfer) domain-containing protein